MTKYKKIRLTPYGASLIVLDFPVTFHQSCLLPLLSSRPFIRLPLGSASMPASRSNLAISMSVFFSLAIYLKILPIQ